MLKKGSRWVYMDAGYLYKISTEKAPVVGGEDARVSGESGHSCQSDKSLINAVHRKPRKRNNKEALGLK